MMHFNIKEVFGLRFPSWSWIKNKTAKKYFHSYIMISIIPVICVCIFACIGIAIPLRRQTEESRMSQLEQLKNELDSSITFMENSTLHLSGLLSADPADTGISGLDEEALVQQLNTYKRNMQLPCEILCYPRGEGAKLYTADGETDYESFQKGGEWNNQLDMIQFYLKLTRVSYRMFLTTRNLETNAEGDYLAYLSPVPNLDISPVGTLAFLVNRQYFDSTVQNYCGDFGGYFLMLDTFYGLSYQYDQCLKYDQSAIVNTLTFPYGTDNGAAHLKIENEEFVLFKSVSKNYGFTYLFAIPEKILYRPVYDKIRVIIVLSLVFLLLLVGAAFFTTEKSYRPLRQLAGDLLRGRQLGQTDPFEQIRNQFQYMESQNTTLQTQVQTQYSLRRQRVLTELLFGWYKSREQLAASLKQVDISFLYNHFFVMVIRMEGDNDPGESVYTAFEQTYASVIQTFWKVFIIDTNISHTAALLINLDEREDRVLKIAQEIGLAIRNTGCFQAKIGVGGLRDDPANVNASYCEALVAMRENPSPIACFQKPGESGENFLCPPTEGKMLQQSLLNGSENMAVELVEQLTQAVKKKQPPQHIVRCYCFYLVILLLQIQPFLEEPLPEEELMDAANHAELDQFSSIVKDSVREICKKISEARQNGEKRKIEALMDYIHRHFGEYTLSVELLAEHFGLSEKMVRQILKEQTGSGLTNYLTSLRMEYIKRQLSETDAPIRELILRVGYADVSSFTRKFKKIEGITPGQYRSMNRDSLERQYG